MTHNQSDYVKTIVTHCTKWENVSGNMGSAARRLFLSDNP